MQVLVDNKIRVTDPSVELINWCNDNLMLDNPEYLRRLRMGKWIGGVPAKFALFEQDGNNLILPFGCLDQIRRMYGNSCKYYSGFNKEKTEYSYYSSIKPYDYQKRAIIEACKRKRGVIVMPCGSGKTQVGLDIVSRFGVKCLWLTHTLDLLTQSAERAKSVFSIPNSDIGFITGGKVNIGAGITFATVQTMAKLDLSAYKDCWDMLIVDECHKAVGSPTKVMMFYKVVSSLACRYKFGLTATPKRSDGLEPAMFALIGDKICEITKEEVGNTTCPVKVKRIFTGYFPDDEIALSGDGTVNYSGLVADLTHNSERFNLVSKVIQQEKENGAMLVLGSRIEYLNKLMNRFEGNSICLSTLGNSKTAKIQRSNALKSLNNGELDCVFATYQLAKEGLDIPNLRTVVFATPEKNEITVTQSAGRVARKSEEKQFGKIIDFVDDFAMFKGWAKKRNRIYRKLGYVDV